MKRFLLSIIILSCFTFQGKCADSLFQTGTNALAQQNYKLAITDFLTLSNTAPSYSTFYNLGVAYAKSNDWYKAKWAFETALKYNPTSNDAQYNAAFVTKKIDSNIEWTQPYSWVVRFFVSIGYLVWVILAIVCSILIGLLIFKAFTSSLSPKLHSWRPVIAGVAIVLFLVSFIGVITINHLFSSPKFAIVLPGKTTFFMMPNGIEVSPKTNAARRIEITSNQHNDWLQLKLEDQKLFWVKKETVLSY